MNIIANNINNLFRDLLSVLYLYRNFNKNSNVKDMNYINKISFINLLNNYEDSKLTNDNENNVNNKNNIDISPCNYLNNYIHNLFKNDDDCILIIDDEINILSEIYGNKKYLNEIYKNLNITEKWEFILNKCVLINVILEINNKKYIVEKIYFWSLIDRYNSISITFDTYKNKIINIIKILIYSLKNLPLNNYIFNSNNINFNSNNINFNSNNIDFDYSIYTEIIYENVTSDFKKSGIWDSKSVLYVNVEDIFVENVKFNLSIYYIKNIDSFINNDNNELYDFIPRKRFLSDDDINVFDKNKNNANFYNNINGNINNINSILTSLINNKNNFGVNISCNDIYSVMNTTFMF